MRTPLMFAHPGKAQDLANLLLMIEQGAAPGVERAQRCQVRRLDIQRLAQVTQQGRRHGPNAVQRPTAHAHEADVQRQAQLVVLAPAPLDQFALGSAEGEEGLQFERGDLARQLPQAQVRCVPALHSRRSPRVEMQAKIRRAAVNSKRSRINDLRRDTRAVAGDPNRHFFLRDAVSAGDRAYPTSVAPLQAGWLREVLGGHNLRASGDSIYAPVSLSRGTLRSVRPAHEQPARGRGFCSRRRAKAAQHEPGMPHGRAVILPEVGFDDRAPVLNSPGGCAGESVGLIAHGLHAELRSRGLWDPSDRRQFRRAGAGDRLAAFPRRHRARTRCPRRRRDKDIRRARRVATRRGSSRRPPAISEWLRTRGSAFASTNTRRRGPRSRPRAPVENPYATCVSPAPVC